MDTHDKAQQLVAGLLREDEGSDLSVAQATAQQLGIVFDGEQDWGPPLGVKWAFSKRSGQPRNRLTFYTNQGASAETIRKIWDYKVKQFGLENDHMGQGPSIAA